MWSSNTFARVHVVALALCAIMVPWSTAYLSMAQMLMVANWLVWGVAMGDLRGRARRAFTTPVSMVFLSIFGLHALGLLWTSPEGLSWGLDLTRILLPVLTFGAVLSSTPRLLPGQLRAVLLLGAWSALTSTVVCLFLAGEATDYRSMSVFISHIRLALLLAFSVVVFLHYRHGPWWHGLAHLLAVVWALHYINRLGSLQSMAALAIIAAVLLWRASGPWPSRVRMAVRTGLLVVVLTLATGIVHLLVSKHGPPPAELGLTTRYTAGGEQYVHELDNTQTENGNHVWTWIAIKELYDTWPLRSNMDLNGADGRGHSLYATLVRYLASKGLRKDSVAVMSLSDEDVRRIEAGIPSALAGTRSQLRERLDEVLFEIEQYRAHGRASGHSVTMRLEFKKVGWAIAREHWTMGVGTGDTQLAFNDAYASMGTGLEPRWWLRAHDQYLTWWISFGVFGLGWMLFAIWWPAWRSGAWRDPLFVSWVLLFGLANLSDDTLETQAGATFFALYYGLLVFAAPRAKE